MIVGKEGEHIGLFVMEGERLSKWAKNALFNGVFGTDNEIVFVSEGVPENDSRFAVQAGPILVKDNSAQSLKLKSDQQERRIVVGISEEGRAIFLVIFDPNSLAELSPIGSFFCVK